MRPAGTQPADAYIERFGWWGRDFTHAEILYLAHGGDFTKVGRQDAIILDKLETVEGVDIVSGQGTNTGTLTVVEPCPIFRPHLGQFWTRPGKDTGSGATRRNYRIGITAGFDTRTSAVPFNLKGPGKPQPLLGPTGRPLTWNSPGGADVTVAITGSSATASAGSVIPSTTVPAAGTAATGSAGTVTPSTTVAATGTAATASAGTVAPSTAVPASGVAATASAGTVAPATDVPITGSSATAAAGNVGSQIILPDTRTAAVPFNLRGPGKPQAIGGVPRQPLTWTATVVAGADVTVALSGAVATASAGSVTPSTDVPAAGTGATASAGALTPATTVAATGAAGTSAAGTVAPGTAVAPTGAAATASPGSVTPSLALALTGAAAAASPGTVSPGTTIAVTGAGATASAGSVTPSLAVALSGIGLTGSPGTVTTSGGVTPPAATSRFCPLSVVLAQIDTRLATVAAASSTDGGLRPGCRFTLEKEPLSKMDGDYFTDVEAITPILRNRAIGEAYWEATVVIRVAYYRGGGDMAGGDRQSVMRDALGDGQRFADVMERPDSYASATSGLSEVRYQGCTRAATFKRAEIWETRFMVRWRSDSFTA